MRSTFLFFLIATNFTFASAQTTLDVIKGLSVELPQGVYQGKGYNHKCAVLVQTDGVSRYSVRVQLENSKSSKSDFNITNKSQFNPDFQKNYVGSSQVYPFPRTFVGIIPTANGDGDRLIITSKNQVWAIKTISARGESATCMINK